MTTIYLVRHGQSVKNTKKIVQGNADDHTNVLTIQGRAQAQEVANLLKGVDVTKIYHSPLTRAQETAQIIAATHHMLPEQYKLLHEKKQGSMQGLRHEEMMAKFCDWSLMTEDERLDVKAVPDEESQRELRSRALEVVFDIAQKHPNDTVFAVTHGGFIRAIYTYLSDKTLGEMWSVDNCGYLKLEVKGDKMDISETSKLSLKE
ncbi:MAG: histidine phosphatase family protein [bacterium]